MTGRWTYVGDASGPKGRGGIAGALAVHAALMPIGTRGSVLYFAGSQWVEPKLWEDLIDNNQDPTTGPGYAEAKVEIAHTRLFNCATHVVSDPGSPDSDLFCCGHSLLADGSLVTAGGTQHFPGDIKTGNLHGGHWSGTRDSFVFDPRSSEWQEVGALQSVANPNPAGFSQFPELAGGRWYPTVITLASGAALALTGHPIDAEWSRFSGFDPRHNNTTPEVFDPHTNTWTCVPKALGVSEAHDYAPFYPRMHVLPGSGHILIVQPLYSSTVTHGRPNSQDPTTFLMSPNPLDVQPDYDVEVMDRSLIYDPTTRTVSDSFLGPQRFDQLYVDHGYTSQETTSVLLPLLHESGYHPYVLLCGATRALLADLAPSPGPMAWAPTTPRSLIDPTTGQPSVRNFANATLLPTGDVVVTGGVTQGDYDGKAPVGGVADAGANLAVRAVEIYRPGVGWIDNGRGAVASEVRGYHSSALLLSDGRIWTAGGELEYFDGSPPNLSIELYEPEYCAVADRVSIKSSPAELAYQETFTVEFAPTSQNVAIRRVALLRNGSCTHGFDGDQRYVSIPFSANGTTLTVTAPPDATIAPPGFYMLWLIDIDGNPSKFAPFVQLTGRVATPQIRDISYIFPVTLN